MILVTNLGRFVVALLIVRHIDTLWLFPEAFVLLVLQKTYAVAKSAVVPRYVPSELSLVRANSRLALISAGDEPAGGQRGGGLRLGGQPGMGRWGGGRRVRAGPGASGPAAAHAGGPRPGHLRRAVSSAGGHDPAVGVGHGPAAGRSGLRDLHAGLRAARRRGGTGCERARRGPGRLGRVGTRHRHCGRSRRARLALRGGGGRGGPVGLRRCAGRSDTATQSCRGDDAARVTGSGGALGAGRGDKRRARGLDDSGGRGRPHLGRGQARLRLPGAARRPRRQPRTDVRAVRGPIPGRLGGRRVPARRAAHTGASRLPARGRGHRLRCSCRS